MIQPISARCWFSLIFFIFLSAQSFSQPNYGLLQPQDASTLPKSKAGYVQPVRKAKVSPNTILQSDADGKLVIKNGWELISAQKAKASGELISTNNYNSKSWYNAVVPGTVLTTLVQQGVYADPYFGLNNLHIPDSLCRQDWWYRTTFIVPSGKADRNVFLNFDGINYKAEIWLNGKSLGVINGAFQQGIFNVSPYLNMEGKNVLAVHIIPPPNPGIPHEESPSAGTGPNGGQLCLDGPTFISSEGWDWVPGIRDRNIGIWQNVSLKFTGAVTISNPHVVTKLPLPDTSSARITISAEVKNISNKVQITQLKGSIGNLHFAQNVTLQPHENRIVTFNPDQYTVLQITHPRLWWPNGYGNPELYTLKLVAENNNKLSDEKTVRFGIRELSYELSVDYDSKIHRVEFNPIKASVSKESLFDNINRTRTAHDVMVAKLKAGADTTLLEANGDTDMAPYMVIKVNGKRIYCKGGNWGMDDAMKQVSRQHLEPYFRLHKDAHFNMIRNWTGESSEEVFYQLCDEYGMLIWNDFWLSTEGYNLNVKDNDLFVQNAKAVIQRFRNHPSIAIWCPRNEGYAPPELEEQLAKLIWQEDGTRYYQPNSRTMNLRTSGPWHYFKNPDNYTKIASGFSTELGTPSIPTAASIRKMMPLADQWPISDTWYYHDFHTGQKEFVAAMDSLYGKATSLDDFCKKAQMLNYDSHRQMFEAWDSKLWNNTSGVLLWMTHPAWPSMVWQTYSWDYETFGSYFASMKACEPVHIQMDLAGNQVMVVNTSLQVLLNCKAELKVYDLDGKSVYQYSASANIDRNKLTSLFEAKFPAALSGNYLVRLKLSDEKGKLVSENDYWKNLGSSKSFDAFNKLKTAQLKYVQGTTNGKSHYTITNTSGVPAIAVKLNLIDASTKAIILPAYFSDGYFNLLPGESKQVLVSYSGSNKVYLAAGGYNVKM